MPIKALKAYEIKPGYLTEKGLCSSIMRYAPYVMLQCYKDQKLTSHLLNMSDSVLIYVEGE